MARAGVRQHSRATGAGDATRARILDAVLEIIRTDGIMGASARAIAREAGVNQASIYYHFGSINDAVLTAVRQMSDDRLARYEQRLTAVTSLPELVAVAAELHAEDLKSGTITVLSQAMAGSVGEAEMGPALAEIFSPWTDLVELALRQAVAGSPLAEALPIADLAYVITALFLGIELVTQLDPSDERSDQTFTAISGIAALFDVILRAGLVIPSTETGEPPQP